MLKCTLFFATADGSHRALHEALKYAFGNCFNALKRNAASFTVEIQKAADSQRHVQLIARAITAGVISERDRLFEYSTGEFYQELSLFIQEVDTKNKEYDKTMKK